MFTTTTPCAAEASSPFTPSIEANALGLNDRIQRLPKETF